MDYESKVKAIAHFGDRTAIQRGELLVREMAKLINDLVDYRYAAEHYKGNNMSNLISEKQNKLKKDMAVLQSDLDIYMELMGLTADVETEADKRLERLLERVVSPTNK